MYNRLQINCILSILSINKFSISKEYKNLNETQLITSSNFTIVRYFPFYNLSKDSFPKQNRLIIFDIFCELEKNLDYHSL